MKRLIVVICLLFPVYCLGADWNIPEIEENETGIRWLGKMGNETMRHVYVLELKMDMLEQKIIQLQEILLWDKAPGGTLDPNNTRPYIILPRREEEKK
jgi:hypothetical protein